MGIFGASREWGGNKKAALPKFCHTSYNDETSHSYTLPKEDPKNIWFMWHAPGVLLTSAFFHHKSSNSYICRN